MSQRITMLLNTAPLLWALFGPLYLILSCLTGIRSLSVQQELPPWKSLWILGCTVKQEPWKIYAVVGCPGQSQIGDVDSLCMYRFKSQLMLCSYISSSLSFPSLRQRTTFSPTLTFSLIPERGSSRPNTAQTYVNRNNLWVIFCHRPLCFNKELYHHKMVHYLNEKSFVSLLRL